ncbi:MAG: hypothetical protein ACHQM6_08105 [Candidatus Kapaibacterium sp.]
MTPIPKPDPKSLKRYEAIADSLCEKSGAEKSKMFGMPTLKIHSKAFCGLFGSDMVFKLTGEEHKRALGYEGAKLFDPSEMNRPMKEWVVVPKKYSGKWEALAIEALKYVA